MNEPKAPENRAYKVTLILLLSLAAFTTAMKELNRLYTAVSSVHAFTTQWQGTGLVARGETPVAIPQPMSIEACPNDEPWAGKSHSELGLSDTIAMAVSEETDCESIEPEVGVKVDLAAGRKVHGIMQKPARVRYVPAIGARSSREELLSVRRGNNWPARFQFKTFDRSVTLEVPLTLIKATKAADFEPAVSPDFLRVVLDKAERKQLDDLRETRKHELILRRLERAINSRRAS
jgi:hypothetical protein